MSKKAALQYHINQAKGVRISLGYILDRVNRKYTPAWMLAELEQSYHVAQCIESERKRDLDSFNR